MSLTRYLTLCVAILFSAATLHAKESTSLDEQKRQADEAYQQSNYDEAARLYQEFIDGDITSADIYYNLGCAHFRLDHLALAIVNYERALRLDPNHRDARESLAFANSRTQDNIRPLPQFFLTRWWTGMVRSLSPQSWFAVLLVAIALLTAAIVWFLISTGMRSRRLALVAILLALLVSTATTAAAIGSSHYVSAHAEAIVSQPAVSVLSAPEQGSTEKFTLHEGTHATIIESVGQWHRIQIADGNTGWIGKGDIIRI